MHAVGRTYVSLATVEISIEVLKTKTEDTAMLSIQQDGDNIEGS